MVAKRKIIIALFVCVQGAALVAVRKPPINNARLGRIRGRPQAAYKQRVDYRRMQGAARWG